jgi:hypothetical protein
MPKQSPFNFQLWEERIRGDLDARISQYDSVWKSRRQVIDHSLKEGKALNGNLVAEYIEFFYTRVIAGNPRIKLKADDAKWIDEVTQEEIVANAALRMVDFKEVSRKGIMDSTYGIGWFWISDPAAEFLVDPDHHPRMHSNAIQQPDMLNSEWEEVSPAELAGLNIDSISPFDENSKALDSFSAEKQLVGKQSSAPIPVWNDMDVGFPILEAVDPTHIVTPLDQSDFKKLDYVARLRLLTRAELDVIRETPIAEKNGTTWLQTCPSAYTDIFPEKQGPFFAQQDLYLVVELFVRRDRIDPNYNNWYAVWVMGCNNWGDNIVIRNRPNPYGGMIPAEPIVSQKTGSKLYSNTVFDRVLYPAELYSLLLKSIERDIKESINKKVLVDDRAQGMSKESGQKICNPSYSGTIKVPNADGVKPLDFPVFDYNKQLLLNMLRNLAQRATKTSDIDQGTAVKKVTARQTEELVQATDAVYETVRQIISDAGARIMKKIIYVLKLLHGESRNYTFGSKSIKWSPAEQDFSFTPVYNLSIEDIGPSAGEQKLLVLLQFLRVLGQVTQQAAQAGQQINIDWSTLIKNIFRTFEQDEDAIQEGPDPMLQIQQMMQGMQVPGMEGIAMNNSQYMNTQYPSDNQPRPFGGHQVGSQGSVTDARNVASSLGRIG